jgi:succinate dehydrogenase / fumarate reductase flavoprotein subunit
VKETEFVQESVIEKAMENENLRLQKIMDRKEDEPAHKIRDELKDVMFEHFGIYRNEESMNEGLKKLNDLQNRFDYAHLGSNESQFNFTLMHFLELESLLTISSSVAMGAILRQESRGSHSRTDYPKRDDKKFLKHSMTSFKYGNLVLEYKDVTLGQFELKERVY